LIILYYYINSK